MNLLKRFRSSTASLSRRQLLKRSLSNNSQEDQSSNSASPSPFDSAVDIVSDISIRVNRRDSRDVTMRAIPTDLDESLRSLSSSVRTNNRIYALKPSLSQEAPLAEEDFTCMICQLDSEESSEAYTTMACGHKCHGSCIKSWLQHNQNSCPMCREIIAIEVPLSTSEEDKCNCCHHIEEEVVEQEEEETTKGA